MTAKDILTLLELHERENMPLPDDLRDDIERYLFDLDAAIQEISAYIKPWSTSGVIGSLAGAVGKILIWLQIITIIIPLALKIRRHFLEKRLAKIRAKIEGLKAAGLISPPAVQTVQAIPMAIPRENRAAISEDLNVGDLDGRQAQKTSGQPKQTASDNGRTEKIARENRIMTHKAGITQKLRDRAAAKQKRHS